MKIFFLSLGSNIEPEINIPRCIDKLKQTFSGISFSSFYETDPVGPAGPDKFWNAAAKLETNLNHEELCDQIRTLEQELGRKRDPQNKFAPRVIDIDVLPQPQYQHQGFIIIPLAELSPETLDTETNQTFKTLSESLDIEETKLCRKVSTK